VNTALAARAQLWDDIHATIKNNNHH
jgi:hypothetical protein